MYNSNIILQIQTAYNQLTKAETKLSISLTDDEAGKNPFGKEDKDQSLAHRIMELHMSGIKETIEKARRVFFFGIGDSLVTAEEARNKLLRITGKVIYAFQNTCSKRSEKSRGENCMYYTFQKITADGLFR